MLRSQILSSSSSTWLLEASREWSSSMLKMPGGSAVSRLWLRFSFVIRVRVEMESGRVSSWLS